MEWRLLSDSGADSFFASGKSIIGSASCRAGRWQRLSEERSRSCVSSGLHAPTGIVQRPRFAWLCMLSK